MVGRLVAARAAGARAVGQVGGSAGAGEKAEAARVAVAMVAVERGAGKAATAASWVVAVKVTAAPAVVMAAAGMGPDWVGMAEGWAGRGQREAAAVKVAARVAAARAAEE